MGKKLLSLRQADGQLLYHYTKSAGIQGIISRKNFWATKSDFLNDTREFSYVIEVVKRVCADSLEKEEWKTLLMRNFLHTEGGEENFRYEKLKDFFVLSFSTCCDSITLWAEFGDTTGYNIAFDSGEIIRKISKSNSISYHGYVVYDEHEQRSDVRTLLRQTVPQQLGMPFEDIMQRGGKDESDPLFQRACRLFQKSAKVYSMFFKQPGFHDEQEYRFVFKRDEDTMVHFREKNGFLIPYVEIAIGDDKHPLPIQGITVAPKNHIDLARKGMEYYLQRHGYDVPVQLSGLKLRY